NNQIFKEETAHLQRFFAQVILKNEKPFIISCPLTHFTVIGIPILWRDRILGSWFISQLDAIDEKLYVHFEQSKQKLLTATEKSISIITKELIQEGRRAKYLEYQNRSLKAVSEQLKITLSTVYGYTDISGVSIFVIDLETFDILFCNKYFADQHFTTMEKVIGTKCYSYFGFDEPCPFCPKLKLIDNIVEDEKYFDWEVKIENHNKWYHLNSRILRWVDGRIAIMASYYDITEKKELQDKLSYIAFYDQRLKVPNGILLAQDIEASSSKDSYLICFDLQELRKINEAYSREAGDELLEEIKAWINRLPYFGINLYRVEGDGFAIFIQDYSEETVLSLAKKIRERFAHPWDLRLGSMNISIFVGVSLGIIPVVRDYKDYSILLSIIERVVDMAKKKGDILLYNEEVSEAFYFQLRLELSLKHSILNNMHGFSVFYQPIADPNTGTWTSMESLCRWDSPEFGPVSPVDFIPIAETTGLIGFIDLWVLEKSIEQVKLWKLDTLSRFVLDVNLSPAHMGDPELCNRVIDILQKYDFPPEKLSLEITESADVDFNERTITMLEKFKKAGIALSLDDFGTGYASFSKLNTLPINVIKLDQSFVRNVEHDYYSKNVIRIMVEFAHAAGFKVVAEGIENTTQMQILLDHQVDFFQGFLFSKPLSHIDLENSLHKFSNSVNVFPVRTMSAININTVNKPGGGYSLSVNLSRLINHCMFLLNGELNITDATNQVLKLVGEQLKLSRTYVVLLSNDVSRSVYQWYNPEVEWKIKLDEEYMDNFVPSDLWHQTLLNDGIFLASDVNLLPDELKANMEDLKINALVELPIWDKGRQIGTFGVVESMKKTREWTAEEVQFLYHICVLFAGIIKRYFLRKEVQAQSEILTIMLDQLDTDVFVADIDTHKILFANKSMQEHYHFSSSDNVYCYDVAGKGYPCEDCLLDDVKKNENQLVIRDTYSDITHRHYRNYDSIIPWSGEKKKVHLHYAMDISQIHKYQDQIKLFTSMDMDVFTTTLSKESFIHAVKDLSRVSDGADFVITICFVKVLDLKLINEQFGMSVGDDLIQSTAHVLRQTFRSYDIIGRYSNNEFVLALSSCTDVQAKTKLSAACDHLSELADSKHWDFKPKLQYGISMNTEIKNNDSGDYLETLISMAHEKMKNNF
ncbi:MAG: EAL domain-containing protein, partial [Treponema sp.]|nr:EAL domain-containing protein [Treponema sp.]